MKRILFLGDSLTDCDRLYSGDGLGFGYVKLLWERLPYKLINEGVNGFMAADISRRLSRTLSCDPDFIGLLAGVNDVPTIMASPSALKSFTAAYEKILIKISQKPCLITAPFVFPCPAELINWDNCLDIMRGEIKRLCLKYSTPYLPMDEIFKKELEKTPVSLLTTDGIHLTHKGHKILAENWLSAFEKIVKC